MSSRLSRRAAAALVLLAAPLVLPAVSASGSAAQVISRPNDEGSQPTGWPGRGWGRDPVVVPATPDYNQLFTRQEQPAGWIQGDGGRSTALPDGRIFWSFGDSNVGRLTHTWPGADGTLHQADAWWLNSSVVVTKPGTTDFTTYAGADPTTGQPTSFFAPATAAPGHWYWPAASKVEATPSGPALRVFLVDVAPPGTAPSTGRAIATVDPTTMAITDVGAPLPTVLYHDPGSGKTGPVNFGSALLDVGRYTYIYGEWAEPGWEFNRKTIVARAPRGQLTDPTTWQYDMGGGDWSSDPTNIVAAADRPIDSVVKVPGGFVMFDLDPLAAGPASKQIRAYRSTSPAGPWDTTATPAWTYDIAADPSLGINDPFTAYLPLAHPEITNPADPTQILVSWSNDFSTPWSQLVTRYGYRPRFTWVSLQDLGPVGGAATRASSADGARRASLP